MVKLWLRPEDLWVSVFQGAGQPAAVSKVEPLHGYTVVALRSGDQPLRALLRGQPDMRVGAQVALGCDPTRVIYFGEGGHELPRPLAKTLGGGTI